MFDISPPKMSSKSANFSITTAEAAEILCVTPARVRQFIRDGRVQSVKHGRDHLLSINDVIRFRDCGRMRRGRPSRKKI
jgi:excisionase family DNA binding protein